MCLIPTLRYTLLLIPSPANTKASIMLEKLLGLMKEIDMAINTQRTVSIAVSTLEAKISGFFDIFLTKKKQKFTSGTS